MYIYMETSSASHPAKGSRYRLHKLVSLLASRVTIDKGGGFS